MKLFVLYKEEETLWKEVESFLIRAKNHKEARKLASEQAEYEGSQIWLDSNKSSCEIIVVEKEAAVIMKNYNPHC